MARPHENTSARHLLRLACRLWNLQTGFTNTAGESVESPPETLARLLEAMSGRKVTGPEALRDLIREARARRFVRKIEPVHVVWDGRARKDVPVFLPETHLSKPLRWSLELETGEVHQEEFRDLVPEREYRFEGRRYVKVGLPIRRTLPTGYHKIRVEIEGEDASALLMSAPTQVGAAVPNAAPNAAPNTDEKRWGLFSPLYAIRSEGDWGIGDVAELEKAQEFTRAQGGSFFGTLPLLPIFCEGQDCDPSPYSPVSRLFWNEVYLDVSKLIRESASARAKSRIAQTDFKEALARFRSSQHVDYGSVFEAKREVLQILSDEFFDSGADRFPPYREFISRTSDVEAYAAFRARGDERQRRYHLYVQFQMDRSLRALHERSTQGQIAGLYLDFPVGVGRSGFDSHRFAPSFLMEANAGAPPDQLFIGGQDWGFAPLHPIRSREEGYEYFTKCIRHHMQYASVLRLDHIMAFHRIYAVPQGMKPKEGAYIRYRPEEFYALLSIEAEKSNVRVVGEDLGTVPKEVRDELVRHDCLRMWVLPFEAGERPTEALEKVPERSLACLNTHDMAPFAGFWTSKDIEILDQLDLLDDETESAMRADREKTITRWTEDLGMTDLGARIERSVVEKLMGLLASSQAELLLINVEDLWGEAEPQNVPGTWKEYPNWRRKLRVSVEDWARDLRITDLLTSMSKLRLEAGRGKRRERADGTAGKTAGKTEGAKGDDLNSRGSPSL